MKNLNSFTSLPRLVITTLCVMSVFLTSCFKERKCEKIKEEWTESSITYQQKLQSLHNSMTSTLQVWGPDSKQYRYLCEELVKLNAEIDSMNRSYSEEMQDADCPDCSIPVIYVD